MVVVVLVLVVEQVCYWGRKEEGAWASQEGEGGRLWEMLKQEIKYNFSKNDLV